jgi:hypothetical protein
MAPARRSTGRLLLKIIPPAAVFAAVWLALLLLHPPVASWCSLTVRGPVAPGRPLRFTVNYEGLAADRPGGYVLSADLHWQAEGREDRGYMGSGKEAPGVSGTGSRDFSIVVNDLPGLESVDVVVYLSPTGQWSDRALAAHTRPIPVETRRHEKRPAGKRRDYRCYDIGKGDETPGREETIAARRPGAAPASPPEIPPSSDYSNAPLGRALPSIISGALCLVCALFLKTRRRVRGYEAAGERSTSCVWWTASFFLLLQGIVFATSMHPGITALWRALFRARGWYPYRDILQRGLIGGIACGWALFLGFLFEHGRNSARTRKKTLERIAFIGVLALASFQAARALSYHYVDAALSLELPGASVGGAVLFALTCVPGSAAALRVVFELGAARRPFRGTCGR